MAKAKKYPDGGEIKDKKSFYNTYLSSPNYAKRLKTQGYSDINKVINDRKKNIQATEVLDVPGLDSQYWPLSTKGPLVTINDSQLKQYNLNRKSTIAHELSHAGGALQYKAEGVNNPHLTLNKNENNELLKRNKLSTLDPWAEGNDIAAVLHDRAPSESKADIDTLRYNLFKDKIYNTGTQKFTQEYLNKAKKKYAADNVVNRLFTNFSDKDLIYLMNNVASNDNTNPQTMAKNGMKIKSKIKKAAPGLVEPQEEQAAYVDSGIKWEGPTGYFNTEKKKPDIKDSILGGLAFIDKILPTQEINMPVVQPQQTYNQNPYGTGSEAMFDDGGKPAKGRKVGVVPKGYVPYPDLGPNYYHNPKQSSIGTSQGVTATTGPKMSNAAWLKYVANKKQSSSDDIVYIEPEAAQPLAPAINPAFMSRGENIFGYNKAGQKVAQGLSYSDIPQSVNSTPVNNQAHFAYYKPGTSEIDPSQQYNIPGDIWSNQMVKGTHLLQDTAGINNYKAKFDDGGEIKEIGGNLHEDGGTPMIINGQQIEAERGETIHTADNGDVIIGGNMQFPSSKKKFKNVFKEIGKQEQNVDKQRQKVVDISGKGYSPSNSFDKLSLNAAELMSKGADMKSKSISDQKEHVTMLQQAMLDTAHEHGIDAQEMSKGNIKKLSKSELAKCGMTIKKYKNGGMIKYADGGTPTRSDRNNNPGNIKYGPFAKRLGATSQDKDGFAIFPSKDKGSRAMKTLLTGTSYNNLSVNDAINKWTAGKPYNLSGLSDIKNKKVSELSSDKLKYVMDYMTKGEGTKYPSRGDAQPIARRIETKHVAPDVIPSNKLTPELKVPTIISEKTPSLKPTINNEYTYGVKTSPFNVPGNINIPSNKEDLDIRQLYPEIYAAATNHVEPVNLQQYNPQLKQPYQVSFQDRLNENNATFKSIEKLTDYNPEALSTLAGQKYGADSAVLADEFRQNDSQNRGIYNDNINTLNDAQLKNLSLADQQYTRQSEARSNTKAIDHSILNSVASKYAQNKLENRQLQAAESMSGMRFDENGHLQWMGGDATFTGGQVPGGEIQIDDNGKKYIKVFFQETKTKYGPYNQPGGTEIKRGERIIPNKGKNGASIPSLYNQIYGKHR